MNLYKLLCTPNSFKDPEFQQFDVVFDLVVADNVTKGWRNKRVHVGFDIDNGK